MSRGQQTAATTVVGLALLACGRAWPGPTILPQGAVPTGWQAVGDSSTFGPPNLYEHINGAAPGYLRYDFRQLTVQRLRSTADPDLQMLVEVYEFGQHLDAFGIYSTERSPGLSSVRLGAEGYLAGAGCRFYRGHYYVKLHATQADDHTAKAQLSIAQTIAEALPGELSSPAELSVLPTAGLVEGSERYDGSDLLAHDFLGAGFTADYDLDDKDRAKLFFCVKRSTSDARRAYWKLIGFLADRGEVGRRLTLHGGWARSAVHPFYERSVICRSGRVVCGVLQAPSEAAGLKLVSELLDRMAQAQTL